MSVAIDTAHAYNVTDLDLNYCYAELEEAILNSDQRIIRVRQIEELYDIKAWIKPYINTPHGHTNPHNFLFRQSTSGRAEMLYRNWSSDPWLPAAPEPGLLLLKVSSSKYIDLDDSFDTIKSSDSSMCRH